MEYGEGGGLESTRGDEKTTIDADSPHKDIDIKDFIRRHLQLNGKKMSYSMMELRQLLNQASEVFRFQPTLLEVRPPITIVGDIHGQYRDLLRIFRLEGFPHANNYLFLGDYIDRGTKSLECICLLLAYKIVYKDSLFTLRGNHESVAINRKYGFFEEIEERFKHKTGAQRLKLYQAFNATFDLMPLAATVGGRILCMHGGISPKLKSFSDIARLERPIEVPRGLSLDLLWADPVRNHNGFAENELRLVSVEFGEDEVKKTCARLDIDLIVRAHQVVRHGYEFFADRHLMTVFSAPQCVRAHCAAYAEFNNSGAVLSVGDDLKCRLTMMTPSSKPRLAVPPTTPTPRTAVSDGGAAPKGGDVGGGTRSSA